MAGAVKRDARQLKPDGHDAWQPVVTAPLLGVICFALAALWFGNRGERWFPLLDGPNLLFHEFGHPFFCRGRIGSTHARTCCLWTVRKTPAKRLLRGNQFRASNVAEGSRAALPSPIALPQSRPTN